jgi:hypothetical protein
VGGGGVGGEDGVKRDRELISDGKCAPQTGSQGQGWILCLLENTYVKIPKDKCYKSCSIRLNFNCIKPHKYYPNQ